MTAVVEAIDIRGLVDTARLFKVTMRLETNSGSVYYLSPANDFKWRITRYGIDGNVSRHLGTVSLRGDELRVGPWTTTGLKDLILL